MMGFIAVRTKDFFTILFIHCIPPFFYPRQVFGFGYHIVVFAIETQVFDAVVSGGSFPCIDIAPCTALYR